MDRSHVDFTGSFADVYDRYLVPMDFAPYGRRLAERVKATAPRSVLETAAGTGVVTRELARILPDNVSITATDLNEHRGRQTVTEGAAEIVRVALQEHGPSGRFLESGGELVW